MHTLLLSVDPGSANTPSYRNLPCFRDLAFDLGLSFGFWNLGLGFENYHRRRRCVSPTRRNMLYRSWQHMVAFRSNSTGTMSQVRGPPDVHPLIRHFERSVPCHALSCKYSPYNSDQLRGIRQKKRYRRLGGALNFQVAAGGRLSHGLHYSWKWRDLTDRDAAREIQGWVRRKSASTGEGRRIGIPGE